MFLLGPVPGSLFVRQSILRVGSIIAVASVASVANAGLLAQWTFDTAINPPVTAGQYFFNPEFDVAGAATAGISHTNQNTTFSTAAGNGSAYSLSADRWSTGDFMYVSLFRVTPGQQSFQLSWDQTRASGGPSDFRVEVSGDSQNWTTISTYNVIQAGAILSGTDPWSATGPRQSAFTNTVSFNLTIVQGGTFNGNPVGRLDIRLVATGLNLGNGAARFDNIALSSSTVPAPGALALLGLGGLTARRRRR